MANALQVGVKQLGHTISKNSSSILTGFGIVGLITTVTLAIKATPKASQLLYEKKYDLDRALNTVETIQTVWKCYIPTAVVGLATIACIVSSNSINTKRNAALASIYALTEKAMQEYQAKVVEVIGKNKEEKIKDQVIEDQVIANPVSKNTIIMTKKGETLCYDKLSSRYFRSDLEHIRRSQNDFNQSLLQEMYKTLNEFYDLIDLENTKLGQSMGWKVENGMLEIIFSAKISDEGEPCIVLDYRNGPVLIN